jgi:hypothetical protein
MKYASYRLTLSALSLTLGLWGGSAQAALTEHTSSTAVSSIGTFTQGVGYSFAPLPLDGPWTDSFKDVTGPFTSGDLAFTSSHMGVTFANYLYPNPFGPSSSYWLDSEPVITYRPGMGVSSLSGTIAGTHDIFGLALRNLVPTHYGTGDPTVTVRLTTNLGSYTSVIADPGSNDYFLERSQFIAFSAGPGEYFTGFSLDNVAGSNAGLGVNGAFLGTVAAVPEPQTYALMLGGLGAICFMARRRRRE